MWEAYVIPEAVAKFEEENKVKFVTTFFDGNSEAYNELRVGGAKAFNLVQADGFWPRLYHRETLIRAVEYSQVASAAHDPPEFQAEKFKALTDPVSGKKIGKTRRHGQDALALHAWALGDLPQLAGTSSLRVRLSNSWRSSWFWKICSKPGVSSFWIASKLALASLISCFSWKLASTVS